MAALAFDRLVINHLGRSARVGSALFAAGTLVQVAIGQLPFLFGESLALGADWAATRHRYLLGVVLGLGAVLASPLAGAFLMLAASSALVASRPHRRVALVLLVAVPAVVIAGMGVVFPDQGVMPFPLRDFLELCAMLAVALVLVPRHQGGVRLGVTPFLAAVTARTP